jgi:outer membrane protein assembly factor BamB
LSVELWRVDRHTGSVIWKRFLSDNDRQLRKQNMSSPSPVTDGEHVWVMTGTGWLRAFDFDGNEVWARNISDDYWSFGLNWGFASSPLLHDDALYVQVLHGMRTDDPSYVLRIDKMTGETVWMVERPTDAQRESPDSYTTPALLQYDGLTEIVITGGDVVTGHDLETGTELWRADGLNPRNNGAYRLIASPLVVGDIIVAPTRVRPMLALQAGGRGDVTTSHRLWSFDDGPDVPTPVSDGELLYVVQDNGVAHAVDMATGEPVYSDQRLEPGTYSASPILADGKIYASSEDGVTTVYRAGREFEVLATNALPGYTLSTPSVAGGYLYIRAGSTLYAIGPGDGR